MKLLARLTDPVTLQVLSDALSERGIDFRIEDAGMHALLPLTGIFDARVMVAEADEAAAQRILDDLEIVNG